MIVSHNVSGSSYIALELFRKYSNDEIELDANIQTGKINKIK